MSSRPSPVSRWFARQRRLGALLLALFVLLALAPTGALTIVSTVRDNQSARESATALLSAYADTGVRALDQWVVDTLNIIRFQLQDREARQLMIALVAGPPEESGRTALTAEAEFTQDVRDLVNSTDFDYLVLLDSRGIVRGSSDAQLLGRDLSSELWFRSALQNPEEARLFGPLRDGVSGQQGLFFAGALSSPEGGAPLGVLGGRVGFSPLATLLSQNLPGGVLGATGDYFLVREGQQYVTPPRFAPGAALALDEILPTALAGVDGSGEWIDYRGEPVLGVYRSIEPLGMTLIVKQDVADALVATRQRTQSNLALGGGIGLIALVLGFLAARSVTRPLSQLSQTAVDISRGDLSVQIPEFAITELGQVAHSLNTMTRQIRSLLESQEATIRARTRQLQITAQIGRAIAAETDLDRLLNVTINSICEQLGYYHAQVFLIDDLRQYAVLRASMGEAGAAMIERSHKLPVGSRSVIGQATSIGEPVLASDTMRAEYWMPNPLLPDTRSELAVPIRIGDQVIGALDVQSDRVDAFDEETIAALQTVADQLAVALRNAQLFDEKEGLISASVQLTQMLTRDNWDSYLRGQRSPQGALGYRYDLSSVQPVTGEGEGDNGYGVRVPIALRGQVIGELAAELPDGEVLGDQERQLVGEVLDRVALALENARLFEQTQLSLQESNRLYQASRRITDADTAEMLAQELVELAAVENAERVALFLLDDPDMPPGDRWVTMASLWSRSPDDPVARLAVRLRTGQPPLLGIEGTPPEGRLVHDVETDPELSAAARDNLRQLNVRSAATFPLITGRRTVGWLVVHSLSQPGAFGESVVRFYRTLADQAATALEGLRLLEQAQSRARRLQATNEVSRAASSILNPDILLPLVVSQISEAFGYYHVQIFLLDEMGEWAVLRASTGEVGKQLLARDHRLQVGSQSVIGQVTSTGQPFIVRDTDTDPVHRRNELLPQTRSEMAIPLKTGDRVVGVLDVQSTQINAFDSEAQAILQSLAGELAVTMENAQLFQEIQDRVAELTTINLVSQAVSRANTLDEVYEAVGTQLTRTFGARSGFLAVLRPDQAMIDVPIFIDQGMIITDIPPQPLGTGLTSHVIRTRQPLLINENLMEEAARLGAVVIGEASKSLLAVPLLMGEDVVGAISIQDQEQEHAYTEAHLRQLTTLAAYIAVKIRNAELLEQAQTSAGELGFLFNVTRAAVGASDLDTSLIGVADILRSEIAGAEAAVIYLLSEDTRQLEAHAAAGYGGSLSYRSPVNRDEGLIGQVARSARSLVVEDTRTHELGADAAAAGVRAAVLVPLLTPAGLIGVLVVQSTRPGVFDENDLRLLETASGTLTAIIQNARLLDEISRANEQLKELDRLKTQFLANMSHELRTPLNSIIGFSRVMLKGIDGELNDMQTQDLSTIYNSGQHLLGLINNILDLSKIEARMMEIQPEYMELGEIVDSVLAAAKGLTKDQPIELYRDLEPGLPQVWGDPQRIRQVLLNLVSNAAKFTQEGSITVRAFRRDGDPETGAAPCVQVDVIDTGIGIPADKLDTIFEAFQQVDGSTTRQYEGTGLGLPISKNFIDLHGGQMWVTSQVGVGSTFSFTVPLHPAVTEASETVARAEGDTRPLVLAVDDEPGVIDLYSRYLEKEGYAVLGLSHALDLVRQAQELQPQAILLDLNLPGKNGWLAIADLRQNLATRDIPVIVCSIEEDRERAAQAGVAGYLIKPIIEDDLIGALRQVSMPAPVAHQSVLVIDPYADHAEYIRAALESTGLYRVRIVGAGLEGLQTLQEGRPDALVLDFDLPDMDGYGLLVSLRSQAETRHLPVVVLTARPVSEEERARLGGDGVAFLSKHDYDAVRLIESMAAAVAHHGDAG